MEASRAIGFCQSPTTTDYLAAIADGLPRCPEEEIDFCKIVWHQANNRIRDHIKNLTDNAFWFRADDELRGYLIAVEEYFTQYDAAVESNRYTDGDAFDEEALMQDLLKALRQEAPELLDQDGERRLAEDFALGLTEEEKKILVSFTSTTHLDFPEVPDEIRNLYEGGIARSEVWEEIRRRRASLHESHEAIRSFRFEKEELGCLFHLAKLLERSDRILLVELLRETGEFDLALEYLEREAKVEDKAELLVDAIRWACERRLPYVFEVGKETELGEVLRLIKQASD